MDTREDLFLLVAGGAGFEADASLAGVEVAILEPRVYD